MLYSALQITAKKNPGITQVAIRKSSVKETEVRVFYVKWYG